MRTWVKPYAIEEKFASNQNIATSPCYSLYCMVAGDGRGNFKTDTQFNHGPNSGYNQSFQWGNEWVKPDRMSHGKPCACGSSYDKNTGKFYEFHKPVVVDPKNINVSDIIDSSVPNGYQATWKSTDTNGDVYQHYGYAINDSTDHPNHS